MSAPMNRFVTKAVIVMSVVAFVAGCSKKQDNSATATTQKTFSTPAEASQALRGATQTNDGKSLTDVLGAKGTQLVGSGDAAEDKSATNAFASKYDKMNRLVAMTDGSQVLYVGTDNYPFPIPLVQDQSSRWYFDANAGEAELRARRIGRNELDAMDTARLIAEAEELYHQKTHQYTDLIVSTQGKEDGLYWAAAAGQPLSPLARLSQVSGDTLAGSAPSTTLESRGYSFRVATSQHGYTVFASPVHYQHSGIMTFSLGRDGTIYQQDLDPKTTNAASAAGPYSPGNGWTQAE
jgi:hypothetical protein